MATTSSEAAASPSAYAYEQLESCALVLSRLSGAQLAEVVDDGAVEQRARAETLRAAAAEGRAAGLAEAHEQIAGALGALREALAGVEALRAEVTERIERDAVELALSLAEQIVAGTLDVAPERVLDVVRGALRRLADRRRITIVVNPDDVELVSEQLDALRGELGGVDEGTVQSDRRIARGGAVVQTAEGALDLQIESQLERARAVVAEELAH
jgi:flagellar assembly protein FliH